MNSNPGIADSQLTITGSRSLNAEPCERRLSTRNETGFDGWAPA